MRQKTPTSSALRPAAVKVQTG